MKIRKTAAIIIAAASMGVSLAAPYSAAMPVMPVYAVEESEYSFADMAEERISEGYADGVYEGLLYKKNTDDKGKEYITITRADDTLKEVTIPAEIDGIKVREISGAFRFNQQIESVVISNGITTIKDYAFNECTNLKYISIPKSVTFIDWYSFDECNNVETVELCTPDLTDIYCTEKMDFLSVMFDMSTGAMSVKYDLTPLMGPSLKKLVIKDDSVFVPKIENATQELLDSFEIPSSVKILFGARGDFESITIPKNIEYIANGAFMENKNLKEVNFEEGFKGHICENAFEICESIEKLDIPSGVTVDSHAFGSCNGLKSISVPFSFFTISEEYEKASVELLPFVRAFGNSLSLEKITIKDDPDGNTVFTLPENSGYYLFSDDFFPSLKTLCFPDSVTEIGEYALGYADSLETVKLPANLEKIGKRAFSACKSLKEINIPESVTEIGSGAFGGCETLENVNIPKGVTEIKSGTFSSCINLQKINIPDSVTVIGEEAFIYCDSLEEINFPEGIKEIGREAFSGCNSLKELIIPDGKKIIHSNAFNSCANIEKVDIGFGTEFDPAGWMDEEHNTFYVNNREMFSNCGNLREVSVPHSMFIKEIVLDRTIKGSGSGTFKETMSVQPFYDLFKGCEKLETINIKLDPDADKVIDNQGLDDFPSLKKVNIPEGIEEIGKKAFSLCPLETIELPKSLRVIGEGAFSSSELTKIYIPENVETIGAYAFASCNNLKEISVPLQLCKEDVPGNAIQSTFSSLNGELDVETVIVRNDKGEKNVKLGSHCMDGFNKLKKVVLPEGITEIGESAFSNCEALEEINIPEGVTTIGDSAFSWVGALKNVRLPESVKSIGEYAFDCFNLKEITILNPKCEIGDGAIWSNGDIVTIYGYKGSTAEKFAEGSEKLIFVPLDGDESTVIGDANLDGDVSLADALLILQHVANSQKYEMSEQAELNADVYNRGDGLTAMDALTIQKYDAKLVTTLPESYQK